MHSACSLWLRAAAALVAASLIASACSSEAGEASEAPPEEAIDQPDGGDLATINPFPTDPLLSQQWGLAATRIPQAWNTSQGEGVVIAILDSGVDLDHPDLAGNLVPGWDFVDEDDQPDDPNGHGTHVAGIAAAVANDVGIAGAAPKASIMPVRVLGAEGGGDDATIANAILWAAENGADVINLSLGEAGFISRLTKGGLINRAIRLVTAQGVVVVAASGNEGSFGQQYRIGVDVLVVNASDPDGNVTGFSNIGDVRAITAPGDAIVSTAPLEPTTIWPEGTNGYAELDGTSMATPLVAGIVALALAAGVPADEVVQLLTATADNPEAEPRLGAGIVNAEAALADR